MAQQVPVKCRICGKEEYVPHYRARSYKTCSVECRAQYSSLILGSKVENKCVICGKGFKVKKSHADRRKCCSIACNTLRRKQIYKGEGNPNYGNRGEKCAAWKGGRVIKHGYVELYMPDHPMSNKDGYVREHRLVMAQHLGRMLKPYEDVHHIDGNRMNNHISNLMLLTRSEHTSLHNSMKEIIRGEKGRIKTVVPKRTYSEQIKKGCTPLLTE